MGNLARTTDRDSTSAVAAPRWTKEMVKLKENQINCHSFAWAQAGGQCVIQVCRSNKVGRNMIRLRACLPRSEAPDITEQRICVCPSRQVILIFPATVHSTDGWMDGRWNCFHLSFSQVSNKDGFQKLCPMPIALHCVATESSRVA